MATIACDLIRTFYYKGRRSELERQLHLHNIKRHFDDVQFANIAAAEQQIDSQRDSGESFLGFTGKCVLLVLHQPH